uniref:Protein with SprT-like domain at the N terminus n=1 Tax=Timema cristinae TaxID=61476 RepID=A0A7R9CZN0_TIMCR|nr:unnamed protein product [Timema cristinae]
MWVKSQKCSLSAEKMDADLDFALALQLQEQLNNEEKNKMVSPLPLNNGAQIHSKRSPNKGKENLFHGSCRNGADKQHPKQTSLIDPSWEYLDPTPDIHGMFLQFDKRFFWGKLSNVVVKWSNRMTSCAGICCYEGHGGLCSISLSAPLLKLRPRKDLVETLLHEMIHAYLFVTHNNRDRDGHGPEFHKHMNRINQEAGTKITVYHTFHDEVALYLQHWWRCNGPCQKRPPFFGMVRRATNRAPGPNDFWWAGHLGNCGGSYIKVKEPEGFQTKKSKNVPKKPFGKDIRSFFPGTGNTLGTDGASKPTTKDNPRFFPGTGNTLENEGASKTKAKDNHRVFPGNGNTPEKIVGTIPGVHTSVGNSPSGTFAAKNIGNHNGKTVPNVNIRVKNRTQTKTGSPGVSTNGATQVNRVVGFKDLDMISTNKTNSPTLIPNYSSVLKNNGVGFNETKNVLSNRYPGTGGQVGNKPAKGLGGMLANKGGGTLVVTNKGNKSKIPVTTTTTPKKFVPFFGEGTVLGVGTAQTLTKLNLSKGEVAINNLNGTNQPVSTSSGYNVAWKLNDFDSNSKENSSGSTNRSNPDTSTKKRPTHLNHTDFAKKPKDNSQESKPYITSPGLSETIEIFDSPEKSRDVSSNCPVCNMTTDQELNAHLDLCLQSAFDDKPVIVHCPLCNKELSEQNLNDHLETCVQCVFTEQDETIEDEDDVLEFSLDSSESSGDDKESRYPCPCCATWIEEDAMNQHLDLCLSAGLLKEFS